MTLAALTATAATSIFVAWEIFMAMRYGESHFLHGISIIERDFSEGPALLWALGFLSVVGTILPAVGLLGLAALPRWRRTAIGAMSGIALVFAALPLLPRSKIASAGYPYGSLDAPHPEVYVFTPLGVLVLAVLALVVWEMLRARSPSIADLWPLSRSRRKSESGPLEPALRLDIFLVGWLASEMLGFFLLSPFPAARRVIGLGIVASLLAGRVASRSIDEAASRRPVIVAAAASVALGLAFSFADYADAIARRDAVQLTRETLDSLEAEKRCAATWYVGHWGFQFYAERQGMRAVIPGESTLRTGDCLVYPYGVYRQRLRLDGRYLENIDYLNIASRSAWSTIPFYYVGPVPLRAQPKQQLNIALYRIVRDYVPAPRS